MLPEKKINKLSKGFTMVELMVALVIGVVLVGAAIQIYLSNKQAFRFQQGQGTVQENLRYAQYFLNNELQKAGFLPVASDSTVQIYGNQAASGACPAFANGQIVVPDTAGTGICYRYQENNASVLGAGIRDCLGNLITAGNMITSRIFVTNNQLSCSVLSGGAATGTTVLVDGISNMQVSYGNDIQGSSGGPPDRIVDSYTAAPTAASDGYFYTVSLQISLVAKSTTSASNIVTANQTYAFPADSTTTVTAPDREYYSSTTMTVVVKNMAQ